MRGENGETVALANRNGLSEVESKNLRAPRSHLRPLTSHFRSRFGCGLGGFDHFPEFWILLQGFVFVHFQAGPE